MKWLKRRLQKWLGVELLDTRLTKLDHYGEAGFGSIYYQGKPVERDMESVASIMDDDGTIYPLDSSEGRRVETKMFGEGVIKKGYDKH